ncbi:acyl-CoA dehydrogenase family protein [Pseudaminobacter sp. 19-2017]|uniref:Acyl-CoA dehydrogenase family protein n=1 Tax=Pseudaminobacter soli (ex Zhang et al. 2022) TaxID=2831468 RepID=A0A942E673_9HYPH|nr:acyl-CoA dehydrogenase family protein [Pseudaminobacter soli]MBS3651985.1 acyl-CoA dehydrogenase family protein [Pseudaminobacter soli]
MDGRPSERDLAFQAEVRSFLAEKLTPEIRAWAARQTGVAAERKLGAWWHRTLFERGWIAPAWPVEHGGTGWDAMQRHIFEEECASANAPQLFLAGLQLCGPVIMKFGTPQQKAFFLPRIRSGEHYWCQGFSEPGSGSDLSSLTTRAVRDGDDYVVTGSKIWTTHAHNANWIFMLVRTSTEGRQQVGISFLLSPMDAPGIEVRPIISMSGEHEVNQVFFDDLRVPVANRVGDENQGWAIAKYLLEFERGGSYAAVARALLREALVAAQTPDPIDGTRLWDDPAFRRRYAELDIEITAQSWTEKRVISSLAAGDSVGDMMASILKVRGSEVQQAAGELAMRALGELAIPDQRRALCPGSHAPPIGPGFALRPTARFLNDRARSIYGGSNEIQRNIIARFVASG